MQAEKEVGSPSKMEIKVLYNPIIEVMFHHGLLGFFSRGNRNSERISNLSKATQLLVGAKLNHSVFSSKGPSGYLLCSLLMPCFGQRKAFFVRSSSIVQ